MENPFREFWNNVQADMRRYFSTGFRKAQAEINKPKIVIETILFKAGFHALLNYRISHLFYRLGTPWIAWFIQRLNVTATGAEIEYNAEIAGGYFIAHPVGIVIGRGSKLGTGGTIYQNVTLGARHTDPVRIFQFPQVAEGVTIYAGAVILGGVQVGENAVIGANAVVLKDIPAHAAAVGVPARVIEKNEESKVREAL